MANTLDMLPDSMLSIIISSLPFKEAARTSILSKRWLKIWQTTQNIELMESFFVQHNESEENKQTHRQVFTDFATKFTSNYQEPTVGKFALAFSKPRNFLNEMETCIKFAILHNAKILELDFSDPSWSEEAGEIEEDKFDLPLMVYGNKNLESLKLSSCSFRVSEFVNFFALKHLSLSWTKKGLNHIKDLLHNCKMLESLNLRKCIFLGSNLYVEIGGKDLRLRSLVIEKCDFFGDWAFIEAPNLTYFRYSGSDDVLRLKVNEYFEEADLEFEIEDEYDDLEVGNNLYNLLDDLYPARVLTVCTSLLQVIPNGDEPMCMQGPLNVQHLTLNTAMHPNEFYGIMFLLKSCPHLEWLTLRIGQGRIFPGYEPPLPLQADSFWATNIVVIKCIYTSLKIIEVKGFGGKQYEVHFLAYLLHIGRGLKRMTLAVDADCETKELAIRKAERLKNIKTASENIQIHIMC